MTALNFPASPAVGQVFDRWVWNGSAWTLSPSAANRGTPVRGGYVPIQSIWPAIPPGPWQRPTGWYQNPELVFGTNGEMPASVFLTAPSLIAIPRIVVANNTSLNVNLMGAMVLVGDHWEQRFNFHVPSTTVSIEGFNWTAIGS